MAARSSDGRRSGDDLLKPEPRVVVVSTRSIIRWGLHTAIRNHGGITTIGDAADAAEAKRKLTELQANVLVVEPKPDGKKAFADLQAFVEMIGNLDQECGLLLLVNDDQEMLQPMAAPGVSLLRMQDANPKVLSMTVNMIAAGYTLSPHVRTKQSMRLPHAAGAEMNLDAVDLTPRETEVLQLLVRGLNNREIAKALTVTQSTVKSHIQSMLNKLGLRDRTHAVIYAYQRGIFY